MQSAVDDDAAGGAATAPVDGGASAAAAAIDIDAALDAWERRRAPRVKRVHELSLEALRQQTVPSKSAAEAAERLAKAKLAPPVNYQGWVEIFKDDA